MLETTAAALPNREPFPTWRIVIWALGSVGSTIIGSLTGLMTYFYIPPQTAQSDFPQYLSSEAILGITLLGFIGYIGGILVAILNPYIANWSDRADRGKMFAYILLQPHPIGLGDRHAWFINDSSIAILQNKDRGSACFRTCPGPIRRQTLALRQVVQQMTIMSAHEPHAQRFSSQPADRSGHIQPFAPRRDQDFLCTMDVADNQ